MAIDFSLSEELVFDDVDLVPPEDVVKEVVSQIRDKSRGMIEGVVAPYNGAVESYPLEDISSFTERLSGVFASTPKMHDIQGDLGKQGFRCNRFEAYIVASELPNYKFRAFFFEYGVGGYPVKVILEQSIADELLKEKNARFVQMRNNRSEWESLILNIFSSKKILKIMQELVNATLIARNSATKSETE